MTILESSTLDSYLANSKKNGKSNKNSGMLDEAKALNIIQNIAKSKNLEIVQVMVLVAGLAQHGASNKNVGTLTYTVDEKTLTNGEVNKAIANVDKNATPRQFYRSIRTDIQKIAEAFNEPGDLAKLMLQEHPNLTITEQTWCSNFQTNNPECPEIVKKWLTENAKKRFQKE